MTKARVHNIVKALNLITAPSKKPNTSTLPMWLQCCRIICYVHSAEEMNVNKTLHTKMQLH